MHRVAPDGVNRGQCLGMVRRLGIKHWIMRILVPHAGQDVSRFDAPTSRTRCVQGEACRPKVKICEGVKMEKHAAAKAAHRALWPRCRAIS